MAAEMSNILYKQSIYWDSVPLVHSETQFELGIYFNGLLKFLSIIVWIKSARNAFLMLNPLCQPAYSEKMVKLYYWEAIKWKIIILSFVFLPSFLTQSLFLPRNWMRESWMWWCITREIRGENQTLAAFILITPSLKNNSFKCFL